MALKVAPGFLFFSFFFGFGVGALREKPPLSKAALLGAWLGAFVWPFFMTLFNKQNSAGENPLVRRVARGRGGGGGLI
jgi:hypothetical protein